MSGFNFSNPFENFGVGNDSTTLAPVITTPLDILNITESLISATTPQTVTGGNFLQCEELGVKGAWRDERLLVSTLSRDTGTVVELGCSKGFELRGDPFLQCMDNGLWNGTMPHCEGQHQVGLSMSMLLYIGVLCGCALLVMFVVTVLLCKFICCAKSKKDKTVYQGPTGPRSVDTSDRDADNPYYAVHMLNRTRSTEVDRVDTVHYAKPEVQGSFVNPGFYEDVYARWRSREEVAERVYDTPWLIPARRLEDQCPGDLKWSSSSLAAHNNYDYGRFGRIPRAQVTEEEIQDSEDLTTF